MSKKDTQDPCLLCGWAEHMGCHRWLGEPTAPESLTRHRYVPWTAVRNAMAKPAEDALVFDRAVWWMQDYAELWDGMRGNDHSEEAFENGKRCLEMLAVAKELCAAGRVAERHPAGTPAQAAGIIVDMLRGWRLPGAVWYSPRQSRWRLAGSGYSPQEGEVCVGVYAPDAPVEALTEDFAAVERRPLVALIGGDGR